MTNLAFSTLACPDWSLAKCVRAAHEYGYDGIELRLIDGEILKPGADAAVIKRTCAGLPVVCVDTSVSLAQPDAGKRVAQIADGKAMIDIAAALGAPFVRVFGAPPPDTPLESAIAAARETIVPLAAYAAASGVCVLLETHDAFCASGTVMRVLDAVADAPEGAGVLWDLLHPFRIHEALPDTIRTLGDRVKHVHVKDGLRPADGSPNWPLVLLGEGDVPTREILRGILASGYAGTISVEWEKKWHPHLAPPEIALPQHIRALREYLA
jgi:sugar phosphate isomerase/epimerase